MASPAVSLRLLLSFTLSCYLSYPAGSEEGGREGGKKLLRLITGLMTSAAVIRKCVAEEGSWRKAEGGRAEGRDGVEMVRK